MHPAPFCAPLYTVGKVKHHKHCQHYPLYYPLLEVLPLFLQSAPGPRPRHSTSLRTWSSLSTRRIISLLTPGQARSRSDRENSPEKESMADLINSVFAPFGDFSCPTRSSNSRQADLRMKRT